MEPSQIWSELIDHPIAGQALKVGLLLVICFFVDWLARQVFVRGARKLVRTSQNRWDDELVTASFFLRIAHLVPILVAYFGVHTLGVSDAVEAGLQRVAMALFLIVGASAFSAFLEAANGIYTQLPEIGHRPIKGYLSFVRIVVYLMTLLFALAVLMDRSPWIFLSGLGAMTAVLLLIFKDTLLSLVASLQITSNDMIHVGDWVEMPQYGADGDVIDVALHAVKVQNWDKTITTVPTHAFITGSFKNWRGMSESNSRRIKRSLSIDVTSIRFLDENEVERFERFGLLSDYIARKRGEISEYNAGEGRDSGINADIRRLTNVGTFRAYVLAYLQANPKIHKDRTLIVRQLGPTPNGLPIEIYCFTNDIAWANYEGIQSDIFDHLLAIAPEFGLRIFQSPAGSDLARLMASPDPARS